jgi:alpha-aminoadipic semialdehyde synthase
MGTPFLNMVYSKHYSTLEVAKADIVLCGERIKAQGLPAAVGPCVIVITGNGNSAKGSLEMCQCLDPLPITVEQLPALRESYDPKRVYLLHVGVEHYTVPREAGKAFDKKDYYANPDAYRCTFEETILPYATCVLNCIYWEPKYPRLVTIEGIQRCFAKGHTSLAALGDISCDIGGSFEFTTMSTTIDQPIFYYHPASNTSSIEVDPAHRSTSIAICSIDHLPAELPRSASAYFSSQLVRFVPSIATTREDSPEGLVPEVAKAVIAVGGKLTPKFEYISALRREKEKLLSRVLIFGAGRMVEPVLDYLIRDPKVRITVVSQFMHEAEALCTPRAHACVPVQCIVTEDPDTVSRLVSENNVIVSLLPATLHDHVARPCIAHARHLVTASYISASMAALGPAAKEAGIVILGEMGLDPGIDHMSALKMIAEAKQAGGTITSFQSWCGGLPSPEDSDNPFGYKFSWSPRGALGACRNHAVYLWDGQEKRVESADLLRSSRHVYFMPAFNLEGYPNRDSLSYVEDYGLQGIKTMLRGTLRYSGWSKIMYGLVTIGLLDDTPVPLLSPENKDRVSWLDVFRHLFGLPADAPKSEIVRQIATKLLKVDSSYTERTLGALTWLGMLSETSSAPKKGTYLDSLCDVMQTLMGYSAREVDMVIMIHNLEVSFADGRKEQWSATLAEYGKVLGW